MLKSKIRWSERVLLALGRLLALLPTPQAMSLLGILAMALPGSSESGWASTVRRKVWRFRGEALWAARQSRVALCRRLRFEGWEHLHQAEEAGRGVVFVGMRPAGWEFALLALGRYGMPVTLATVTLATPGVEDNLLLTDHCRVGDSAVTKDPRQGLGPVCAAFLGVDGEPGIPGGPNQLKVSLEQGAAVIPLFALREGRGWRLVLWQSAVFKERTTSKKEQALQWMHRICMQAAEAEARRLADD